MARQMPCILLFRDSLFGHALARFLYLAQDVLTSEIAGTNHAGTNGEIGSVTPEPAARRCDHGTMKRVVVPEDVKGRCILLLKTRMEEHVPYLR